MGENPGMDLDLDWINKANINAWSVNNAVKDIKEISKTFSGVYKAAWLLRAVTCIDLTTLAADDTRSNVTRLCLKALNPVKQSLLTDLGFVRNEPLMTAAVCVYPARVKDAVAVMNGIKMSSPLPVASVATGFPTGQYGLQTRLDEIKYSVHHGATEIDVVVDRSLVLTQDWDTLYLELKQMKEACGSAEMKTILAVGELATLTNVYKASLVAMMAGSDFIKTSTGKETVNATLPVGLVMMRAIRDYYKSTNIHVGFKAAGGIKTADDAIQWLCLVKRELGKNWLNNKLFRIGASSLLGDIEKTIFSIVHGTWPAEHEFIVG